VTFGITAGDSKSQSSLTNALSAGSFPDSMKIVDQGTSKPKSKNHWLIPLLVCLGVVIIVIVIIVIVVIVLMKKKKKSETRGGSSLHFRNWETEKLNEREMFHQ